MILPGSFASRNPRAVTLAGVSAFRAALGDGLAVGLFGWADPATGYAANARTNAGQMLGFVLPVYNGCMPVRRDSWGRTYIRPGYGVTLCSMGDFWVRFDEGAEAGQPVYADLVDGHAICGYAAGAELTPWKAATAVAPGGLAIITTFL